MLRTTRGYLSSIVLTILPSSPALSSAPPPPAPFIEREEVRLVTLDVVVEEKTDSNAGWQVCRDLRKDQIEVLVGGAPVELDVFEAWCPSTRARETPTSEGGRE